jgi:hypothetical protein
MSGHEEYTWIVALAILALFIFGMLVLLRRHLRESREIQMQTEVHKKLLERFESPQELSEFLSSESGRRLLTIQSDTVHDRILAAVQAGCVLTLGGPALTSAGSIGQNMFLFGLGLFVTSIGLGFFAAAALSWKLASRWGLMTRR